MQSTNLEKISGEMKLTEKKEQTLDDVFLGPQTEEQTEAGNGTPLEDAAIIAADSVSVNLKESNPGPSTAHNAEGNEALSETIEKIDELGKPSETSNVNANTVGDSTTQEDSSNASAPEPSKDSELDGTTDEAPAETPSACLLLPLDKIFSLENVQSMLETPEYKKSPEEFQHLQNGIAELTEALGFDNDAIETIADDLLDSIFELFPKEPPMNRSQMADRLVFAILIAQLKKRDLEKELGKPAQDAEASTSEPTSPDGGATDAGMGTAETSPEPQENETGSFSRHDYHERLPQIISSRFDGIEERNASRIRINEHWFDRSTDAPGLLDVAAFNEFKKDWTEHSEQLKNCSYGVNKDILVLCAALRAIQIDNPSIDVGRYVDGSYNKHPRDSHDVIPPPKEKEAKKPKDVPGQTKLATEGGAFKVKDDGSEAEPASECVTEKVDPEKIDEELAKRDSEPVPVGDCEESMPEIDVVQAMIDTLTQKLKVKKKVLHDMWAAAGSAEAETDEQKLAVAKAVLFDLQQMELDQAPAKEAEDTGFQMETFERLANASTEKGAKEKLLEVVRLAKILGMDGEQLKERFMIGEQFNVTSQQVEKVKQEIQLKLSGFYLELADLAMDLDETCQAHIEEIIGFALQMEIPGDELKARFEHPLIPSYGEENLKLVAEKIEADYLAFADKNSPPEKKPEAKQDKRPVAERKKAASKKKK